MTCHTYNIETSLRLYNHSLQILTYLKGKLEAHHDVNTRQGTRFNSDQIKIKRQVNTWAIALRESPLEGIPPKQAMQQSHHFPVGH